MIRIPLFIVSAALGMIASAPAVADDRILITHIEQQMVDALVPGQAAVWNKYIDPTVIYAEEDDSYKGKANLLKEIKPLPKGLNGSIKVVLLSYHEEGNIAVALFRQVETEQYFGQTLHANYLTNTVWKKRSNGWRQIEGQVLAEKTDPPVIRLTELEMTPYAGTYKLKDSDPTYVLTIADGHLIGARNGHKPETWNAETRDVFFLSGDPRIRKIFRRDAEGRVVGFIERRESWDIVWNKIR